MEKSRNLTRVLVLPRYQDTGRLRGYCLVTFKDAAAKEKSKEMHKQVLDGRYLEISEPTKKAGISEDEIREMRKKITEDMRTIFVKNLPYDCTENEVGDFFRPCGKIANVRFVFNSVHGNFKGLGNKIRLRRF